ncbi:MAG: hypothetical protein ABEJ06_05845 [Haloarculaceae archaeon]
MKRRTLLSALAGGAGVGLAGCASPLTTRLDSEEAHDGDGETTVRFEGGGTEKAAVTYMLTRSSGTQMRFLVNLSHDVSAVRSFRLRFRPRLASADVPPVVTLERPDGYPYPSYRFQGGEGDGWTRYEVADLGAQAPGTFTVKFWFLHVDSDESLDVTADLRAELEGSAGLRTYTATALTTVEGPRTG